LLLFVMIIIFNILTSLLLYKKGKTN